LTVRRNRLDAARTRQLIELGGLVHKAGLVPERDYADELLDIESYATFDIHRPRFYPASKAELFQAFVEPVELSDGSVSTSGRWSRPKPPTLSC
jgi:Conjugal transfer protein TraD